MSRHVIVVGGVACGPKAAARLRRLDAEVRITVIEQGEYISYAGCGLPYFVGGDIKEVDHLLATASGALRNAGYFKKIKDIDFLVKTRVESIDRATKTVKIKTAEGGCSTLAYDNLVLATGATAFRPPIQGLDLKGVSFLTKVEEGLSIRKQLAARSSGRVVIIGAGLIGLEAAEAFRHAKWNVQMIEMLNQPLGGLFDFEMARAVDNTLFENMVTTAYNEKVVKIEGDESGNCKAVVTNEKTYPADLVLVATGFKPNTELAKAAGLEIGASGGIAVNESMQTSDPFIYAGGDCVECREIVTGKGVFVPLGSTANKHGRVIGDNLAGVKSRFPGVLGTSVVKVFGLNVGRTGLTEKQAIQAGYDVVTSIAPGFDKAHYYPGSVMVAIKLVADRKSEKVLGVQAFGTGEIARRVDVAVAAISMGATVSQLAEFDLGYAPPFAQAVDAILNAANVAENKMKGFVETVPPQKVKQMIDAGDDFILLDVRSPREYEMGHIDAPQSMNLPLNELREKAGSVLSRDKQIVTLCKISQRGYEAQRTLAGMGFEKVAFMDGGLFTWPWPDDIL